MEIKEYLSLRGINSVEKTNGEIWFNCPFHVEDEPSCSINKKTEEWHCFGCGASGKNLVSFELAFNKKDGLFDNAKEISKEIVNEKHANLIGNKAIIKRLWNERRISEEVLTKYSIGWDGSRIWVPIKYKDKILNVKMWDAFKLNHVKYYWLGKKEDGYITNGILFPYENIKEGELLYTEGEGDCFTALSMGIPSITGGGTGFDFLTGLIQLRGKKITLCFDCDNAGKEAEKKAINRLKKAKIQYRILNLTEIGAIEGEDLTELSLRAQETEEKLKLYFKEEPYEELFSVINSNVTLTDALAAKFYKKSIKFSAFITSIDTNGPRQIAKKIMISKPGGEKNIIIIDAQENPEFAISLFYSGGFNEEKTLRAYFGAEKTDRVIILETQTLLHLQLQQDYLQTNIKETSNFMVDAFIENYRINPYKTYEFMARVVRNPKTQNICFFIIGSETTQKYEKKITEEDLPWLKLFWVKEN